MSLHATAVSGTLESHISRPPLERAFWEFHRENPEVYTRLVTLARAWKERRPGQKLGMKMLFEVLRWEVAMKTTGDTFRLNNNLTSYYSRLIMQREPELSGLFETRRLHDGRTA